MFGVKGNGSGSFQVRPLSVERSSPVSTVTNRSPFAARTMLEHEAPQSGVPHLSVTRNQLRRGWIESSHGGAGAAWPLIRTLRKLLFSPTASEAYVISPT